MNEVTDWEVRALETEQALAVERTENTVLRSLLGDAVKLLESIADNCSTTEEHLREFDRIRRLVP